MTREMDSDTLTSVQKTFRQSSVLIFKNEESESQSGMNQEPSGSEQGIGHAN